MGQLLKFNTEYEDPNYPHTVSDVLPDDQVGPLIVPGTYVPSTSVVVPEMLESLLADEQVPEGLRGDNKGEMAEKQVYDLLKEHYSKKKGAALIIQNNTLAHPDATKKEIADGTGKQEADFLVVDKDIQTLINVEAKSFLGKHHDPEKPEKDWPK